jgi:hypothetical protein
VAKLEGFPLGIRSSRWSSGVCEANGGRGEDSWRKELIGGGCEGQVRTKPSLTTSHLLLTKVKHQIFNFLVIYFLSFIGEIINSDFLRHSSL